MAELRNRVVQIRQFGDTDGLEVVDAPLPHAGQDEVRVRVLASGLEYTDTLIRRHLYPQTAARRPPFVMGYDLVGEIDQLGNGVSGFQIGDRVADMTVVGSNAAYCTLKAKDLTRVPAGVDAAEAAALILSWMTAYQLLHRAARVRRGQRVLVHGAAGAVGQALIVLGKMAGLELWGAARGRHAPLVRELGAIPIDHDREDFTRVLPGGKRAQFYSINVMRARHPSWFQKDLEQLFSLLASQTIRPRIAERISFDRVPEAHRRLEQGGLEGKLVLCPEHRWDMQHDAA